MGGWPEASGAGMLTKPAHGMRAQGNTMLLSRQLSSPLGYNRISLPFSNEMQKGLE
jgi:hypothetical protein